jgi:ribosomal protein L11 methyltransferase
VLTNFLWELGAVGVVEDGGLHAYFPPSAAPADLVRAVTAYLEGLRSLGHAAAGEPVVVPLEDQPWAEAWKAHFAPMAIGRRLMVAPPWDVPDRGRIPVVIEPGRAFGTGRHESTAGALVVTERQLEGRAASTEVLDLGTGSGVLAIAAALLGVPHALGIDTDPEAIAAARVNCQRNGVADRVTCEVADVATLEVPPRALVVANILAPAHVRLASAYRRLVAANGVLIVGGLLDVEAPPVTDALRGQGFVPCDDEVIAGWSTLAFTAP